MKYRLLKRAKIKLSEISFGCMSLGENHQENSQLIHAAFDGGINYFDTADIYQNGLNEESVGKALKPFRKQVYLATKVGNQLKSDGSGFKWNPSKNHILQSIDSSLRRLRTDYIDNYQLHGGTIEDNRQEVIEAFEILKQQGKILNYGISSIRPNVIKAYAENHDIVSDMLQYSLLDRRPEENVLDILNENGVGVIVRGGLAKGLLVQKDLSNYLDYDSQDIELLRNKIDSFSIEKTSHSQLALKWILANKKVTSVAVGVRTMNQLRDVLGVFDTPDLSKELVSELSSILVPNLYVNHRI